MIVKISSGVPYDNFAFIEIGTSNAWKYQININTCFKRGNNPPHWRSPRHNFTYHYSDVIMGTMAYQITSLTIVYSTVYWRRSKKPSRLRVSGHRWIPSAKGHSRGKCFHLLTSSRKWWNLTENHFILPCAFHPPLIQIFQTCLLVAFHFQLIPILDELLFSTPCGIA